MKYLCLILLLTSCNALKTLTNGETDIPEEFHHVGDQGPFHNLHWSEGSYANSLNVTAFWEMNLEPGALNLVITYYQDSSCTTLAGVNNILSSSAISDVLTGADGMTYTFDLVADYGDGNTVNSYCSHPITLDTSPPVAATTLSCSGPTATWTVSTSTDVSYQRLNYFTDAACSTDAIPNSSEGLGDNVNNWNVADDLTTGTYYFNVESFDQAGNLTTSACSSACTVSF